VSIIFPGGQRVLKKVASPSSPESLYAFDSSIAHCEFLQLTSYAPASCLLAPLDSAMKSPLSAVSEDFGDPSLSTVAPRDVMSSLHDTLWSLPIVDQESNGHMEPLFGASVEDAPSQALLAIDGLHPSIPSLSTLFSKQNLVDPDRDCSSQSSTTISRHSEPPHTGLSALSPCLDSSSSPSQSLSILPPHKTRRSSVSSDSSLRVPTSPNRSSPRQHPYARPTADPGYAAAAEAASMTLEEYILIVEALQGEDTFKGWDWRSGLPELVKPIVGSPQTRRASEERRMDSATFHCPVRGCGSTVTKKHNLVCQSIKLISRTIDLIIL